MPGPPPPPPPNAPPPLSAFAPPKGNADDRGALLKSIQKGAKLKKTVTNDKSAPLISAKVSNNNSNSSASSPAGSAVPNGMGLGGLFAGGMPKLRPTGKLGTPPSLSSSNNNLERRMPTSEPTKNFSSIQNELKKQLASDNKQRGPPPPAPIRNISDENVRVKPSNGLNLGVPQGNVSTLHRKTKSNANLSAFDTIDNVNNGFNNRPVINHGKPNLAPKPPVLNGKPAAPPKKLILNGKPVSRAHSMKSPRSPSPQSPAENTPMKFGTVRNMSSIISQSLTGSAGNLSPRPRNGRPSAPPPSIPPQPLLSQSPLPPSKLALVKPPNHAPPPPPSFLPQPPSHPPPLPPHRTQPSRAPPAVPGGGLSAPAPPPRNSSMREVSNTPKKMGIDLEEKFKHLFQSPDKFPRPPPYRNVLKLYSNKQVVNKQQAPQPPQFHVATRPWDPTAC